MKRMTSVQLIVAERKRQIMKLGYDENHDRQHGFTGLMQAAAAYALFAAGQVDLGRHVWPWDRQSFKPGTPERAMEKSGAMVVAALDLTKGK